MKGLWRARPLSWTKYRLRLSVYWFNSWLVSCPAAISCPRLLVRRPPQLAKAGSALGVQVSVAAAAAPVHRGVSRRRSLSGAALVAKTDRRGKVG